MKIYQCSINISIQWFLILFEATGSASIPCCSLNLFASFAWRSHTQNSGTIISLDHVSGKQFRKFCSLLAGTKPNFPLIGQFFKRVDCAGWQLIHTGLRSHYSPIHFVMISFACHLWIKRNIFLSLLFWEFHYCISFDGRCYIWYGIVIPVKLRSMSPSVEVSGQ